MVKKIVNVTYIVIICFIIILSIIKINKRHEDKLYNVLYSKIEYAAKLCYLEKKCESSITLETLYEYNYLDIQYDPISKEELNKNLEIFINESGVNIKK